MNAYYLSNKYLLGKYCSEYIKDVVEQKNYDIIPLLTAPEQQRSKLFSCHKILHLVDTIIPIIHCTVYILGNIRCLWFLQRKVLFVGVLEFTFRLIPFNINTWATQQTRKPAFLPVADLKML